VDIPHLTVLNFFRIFMKNNFKTLVIYGIIVWEIVFFPFIFACALISRFFVKRFDVGLGPEPLINNVYHKKTMELFGYKTETFVNHVYYITNSFDKKFLFSNKITRFFCLYMLNIDFLYVLFSYKILYIYFNGGPLMRSRLFWRFEPFLLSVANIKTVVMPYGGDVQILNRTPNLLFRHCMSADYPLHKKSYKKMQTRMIIWTSHASHVISGCDWVDYMYHWDTLMVSHFSIDMTIYNQYEKCCSNCDTLKILHAPNHRNIKGTGFVIDAVNELKREGYNIDLVLLEKTNNEDILKMIQNVDLVIDQLVIGWYAMFAIEAMLANKPVMCYLREDLLNFYRLAGLISPTEPPLINSSPLTIKHDLMVILQDRSVLDDYACRGFEYVNKVHSLNSVGTVFDKINRSLGVQPRLIEHKSNN
jgi:hypothetical protein